jgi:acyl dehydratase
MGTRRSSRRVDGGGGAIWAPIPPIRVLGTDPVRSGTIGARIGSGGGAVTAVGDELPELVVAAVDAEKMKTMAALLRDPNPIHWDVDAVRDLGMGDRPVNQGPNNMAYLVNLLASYAGGYEGVLALRVRFLANVFAGDRLVAGGTVTAVDDDGPRRLVRCDVWLRRDGAADDTVMAGQATVALPEP